MSLRTSLTKYLGAIALALGILFFSASAATAAPAPYPPTTSGPTVVINSGLLQPGQSITLTFTGFGPNDTITVIVFSDPITLGTFAANGAGTATVSVALPAGLEAGAHTIVGSGSSGKTASLGFTIPSGLAFTGEGAGGGSTGGGSGLAFTGIAVGGSLIVAVGLLTAGTMTLLAGRRKNSMN